MPTAGEEMRFSDEELQKLRLEFDAHAKEERAMMADLCRVQNKNTLAIQELTVAAKKQAANTAWATEFGHDVKALARFSKGLQKLAAFLVSISIIGAGFKYLLDHLGKVNG